MIVRITRPCMHWTDIFQVGDVVDNHVQADQLIALGFAEHVPDAALVESPSKSASKSEWVTYREIQGHDVAGFTRDQLIDLDVVVADVVVADVVVADDVPMIEEAAVAEASESTNGRKTTTTTTKES
ncbi:MAG TPA: hypothetical protein VNJ54_04365 [Plantibacter sp.]|uniref:hypothetical protein n=1 Tax=Plantibacter sp. TaxID=1871045 RepID=UPI002BEB4E3C|nr:hypothetical protein [Plantibacter sp.]